MQFTTADCILLTAYFYISKIWTNNSTTRYTAKHSR